uniref:sphingomyelin phosphodiesterase n=1 Tax=Calidris pygmaea TaxID=425635 RepID=A0A8C3JZA3_9CHAR
THLGLPPPARPPPPPAMLLPESPFPSRALAALDSLATGLLAPSFWAINRLLDLQPTTAGGGGGCCGCVGRALAAPALATLLLLSLPLAALGLLLWLPVQATRRPFVYQHAAGAAPAQPWDLRERRSFTFLTANLCLLPSGLAKFSNLGDTPRRATAIARRLAPGPPSPRGHRDALVAQPGPAVAEAVPVPLAERLPADADFLCLQEVFDAGAATILRRRLAGTFPHLLFGVGGRGLRGGQLKLLDSGLLLASRYPLLAARYHGFPNGACEDALAAKGLLAVQVLLGSAQGQRVVGYLGCTHLQAPAGEGTPGCDGEGVTPRVGPAWPTWWPSAVPGGQRDAQEPAMGPGGQEGQWHPGGHQEERGEPPGRSPSPSALPWGGPIWSSGTSSGLPSSRRTGNCWRGSSKGLQRC